MQCQTEPPGILKVATDGGEWSFCPKPVIVTKRASCYLSRHRSVRHAANTYSCPLSLPPRRRLGRNNSFPGFYRPCPGARRFGFSSLSHGTSEPGGNQYLHHRFLLAHGIGLRPAIQSREREGSD